MRPLDDGLWVAEAPQRFFGVELGARTTLLRTSAGLLLHSPVAATPDLVAAVDAIGPVRWLLAPNRFHHLHVGGWVARGVEPWCALGLREKRPDVAWAGDVAGGHPFGSDVALVQTRSLALTNEVALVHRPTRTLVLTDLAFNLAPTAPLLTRVAMACACGYPGFKATLLERVLMRRDLARTELAEILALDFDRVVVAHGEVVERGGKDLLRQAYAWLGPLP